DVHDAVRRVEHPELGAVRSEREAVARRVRPEAGVPGEALEVRDEERVVRVEVENANPEQATLRHEADSLLRVLDTDPVGLCGHCGSEPLRLRETQRPEQTLPPIHVEEARGAIEDHDLVAVRRTVCRWAPGFRSRHEAARNLLSAEVHRQTGDDTNDDHCERGRSQPHPPHPASAESNLGRAASRAASASSKRQRSRSCSSISLETARTSTAGTPATLAARNTAKPSIAS